MSGWAFLSALSQKFYFLHLSPLSLGEKKNQFVKGEGWKRGPLVIKSVQGQC